jgi:SET domain-containing protein
MVKSVLSDKVEIRESKIHKMGMFAKGPFKKCEVVIIKGGHILKREQIFSSGVINSYYPIDDTYFLGAMNSDEEEGIKLYVNHSCNPNCGLRGEITFIAIRDIATGEELTIDYAFVDNEDYSFNCTCGEKSCRSIVTGRDWRRKEIQDKYFDYFAAYLKEKILKGID